MVAEPTGAAVSTAAVKLQSHLYEKNRLHTLYDWMLLQLNVLLQTRTIFLMKTECRHSTDGKDGKNDIEDNERD